MVYLTYKDMLDRHVAEKRKSRKFVSLLDAGLHWKLGLIEKQALVHVRILIQCFVQTLRVSFVILDKVLDVMSSVSSFVKWE